MANLGLFFSRDIMFYGRNLLWIVIMKKYLLEAYCIIEYEYRNHERRYIEHISSIIVDIKRGEYVLC